MPDDTPRHIKLWRKHHGPVPSDRVVGFRDGNRFNCHISNLELITRAEAEQRRQLGFHRVPADLRVNIRVLAKLKAARLQRVSAA